MRKKRRLTPDEIDHKRSGNRMALMKAIFRTERKNLTEQSIRQFEIQPEGKVSHELSKPL